MLEPKFDYIGSTTMCTIIVDNKRYTGQATCHPNDSDMENRRTGEEIALMRAMIKIQQSFAEKTQIELNALKQAYYSMNQSKKFNPKSYENIMLQRQIRLKEEDLIEIKSTINYLKGQLKDFIDAKDALYVALRARRQKLASEAQLDENK